MYFTDYNLTEIRMGCILNWVAVLICFVFFLVVLKIDFWHIAEIILWLVTTAWTVLKGHSIRSWEPSALDDHLWNGTCKSHGLPLGSPLLLGLVMFKVLIEFWNELWELNLLIFSCSRERNAAPSLIFEDASWVFLLLNHFPVPCASSLEVIFYTVDFRVLFAAPKQGLCTSSTFLSNQIPSFLKKPNTFPTVSLSV